MTHVQYPFALSLSKGCLFLGDIEKSKGQGFDKLSPNGTGAFSQ